MYTSREAEEPRLWRTKDSNSVSGFHLKRPSNYTRVNVRTHTHRICLTCQFESCDCVADLLPHMNHGGARAHMEHG